MVCRVMKWNSDHYNTPATQEVYESFYKLHHGFTLSFRRKDAPTRPEAEKLICELIRDSLEEGLKEGEKKPSLWVEINTDDKEVPTGFHIAFVNPLTTEQTYLLEIGLEKHRRRRGLGNRPFFYKGSLTNAESYFWKNTGTPTRKKISLRKKRKHTA